MSAEGALLFARYAYPPNELGYCGPAGARAMLDPSRVADIEGRARHFEGAWSYLELLAEALDEHDPLATDVVEAYWVGNRLLDHLDPGTLVERLQERFRGQVGGTWRQAGDRAKAHHSFQVFEVYPWAGMLVSGRPPGPAVQVLNNCRIRVGRAQAVEGESVVVTSRQLLWEAGHLHRSSELTERVRWSVDGRSLIPAPDPGDMLALHWDWVCDVLAPAQAARVEELEARQLDAVGMTPVRSGAG